MRIAARLAPLAFVSVLAGFAPAHAATVIPTYTAVGAETVMDILRSLGPAQMTPDGSDPQGPIIKVQAPAGLNYSVYMDDCDGGQPSLCKSLEFRASLPPGAMNFFQLNKFNESMRYATAYFADKGVPMLRMDVNVRGGVTADFLAYSARIFLKVVAGFVQQTQ